ncbi:MAG: zinc ABC transporter substrate-binding protein [Pseudomonadota bacterium]|nr:zinc ABC transporter substrate-binding protein [Pseudomonadota bacterium]
MPRAAAAATPPTPSTVPSAKSDTEARPLAVVCSFSILADITRNVAGAAASVTSLVGTDSDAHVFEPTPTAVRSVAAADVVVVNGLGFEGWLPRLIATAGFRGPVVVASTGVATRRRNGSDDPHIWQDLGRGAQMARTIATALQQRRPGLGAVIEARVSAYMAGLAALDRNVREQLAAIPRQRRRVVTAHDAFAYFGAAYGVDFSAAQVLGTGGDASAARIGALLQQLRRHEVQAIFAENIADARLIERIAHDSGVAVGGRLYSDALSAPGTSADSYARLVAHNAATIVAALRGGASSRPA